MRGSNCPGPKGIGHGDRWGLQAMACRGRRIDLGKWTARSLDLCEDAAEAAEAQRDKPPDTKLPVALARGVGGARPRAG